MTRLDRAGVDYVLQMAHDAGFEAIRVETVETNVASPEIHVDFIQRRIVEEKTKPEPEEASPATIERKPPAKTKLLDGTEI